MENTEEKKPTGDLLVYQGQGINSPIHVRLEGDTVWLSQKQLAELYGTSVPNISQHISGVYEDEEMAPEATIKKYLIVQTEGLRQVKRLVDHYNLEMIIAVGFRVRSKRGGQFRKWATERIGEYLVKGFTMDDDRLMGKTGAADYFDELLARIREIRASEARVYLMIRDIFKLANDYQEGDMQTQLFFATMQNKMHFAATGMTAAEIVQKRANADLPNMGLTNWKGARVLKTDIGTAKNYLEKDEIDTLNRITVMFLDQAEFRANRRQNIYKAEWEQFLDKFLNDMELPVLDHSGSVSHDIALEHAGLQYEQFADKRRNEALQSADQRYVSDLKNTADTLKSERGKSKRDGDRTRE